MMARPRGFSVVELCIVIAIIVLLLAILLPALSRVRETSRTALCLSNLRQIGQATLGYTNDHNRLLMPAAYRPGKNGVGGVESYATILHNLGYIRATPQDPTVLRSTSRDVFRCPSGIDDRPSVGPLTQNDPEGARFWRVTSNQSGVTIDTWFGINGATWFWDGLPARRIPNDVNLNDYSQGNYLQILRGASRVVLLFDGHWMNVAQTNKPERINARHGFRTQTNFMFCDGSAATYQTSKLPKDFASIAGNKIKSLTNRDTFNEQHPDPQWVFGSGN